MTKKDKSNGTDDYEVGYKKPPAKNQFQPGKSGNPKGRPKDSRNLIQIMKGALLAEIPITENGNTRHITKFEAGMHQLANKAAMGDHRAIEKMLQIAIRLGIIQPEEGGGGSNNPPQPTGAVILPAGVPAEEWEELYGEKARGTYRPKLGRCLKPGEEEPGL